jgi:peptidoglycan/xylan/chitin deacetylase (PgdA/CDA1 family)
MIKSAIRSLLAAPPLLRLYGGLPGTQLSLFTLHRFAVPDLGVAGHDPEQLAATLAVLRRERTAILPLATVVEAMREHRPLPKRAVVFTVDDGYFDFAEVGAPVFERYDCPVTVFLVTGFLDRTTWLWWDKVRFIFTHGELRSLSSSLARALGDAPAPGRLIALAAEISRQATPIPNGELLTLVDYLAASTGVVLPESAPEPFRPMSWDSVRGLAGGVVAFGPHTVTHPVLSRTGPEHAAFEITESWRRLREVDAGAVPVFSYPNGGYGRREMDLVREAGLRAAVTTTPSYLVVDGSSNPDDQLFRLPRFPYPDQTQGLLLTSSGFRRLRRPLRAE